MYTVQGVWKFVALFKQFRSWIPLFFSFFFFFIVVLDARGKVQDSSSRQSFDGIGNVGRKILGLFELFK